MHCPYCPETGIPSIEELCPGCGGPLLLNSVYRILRKLPKSGMGTVYECSDDNGVHWAVKEMTPPTDSEESRTAIEFFYREAHLLTTLNHSNLPKVEETFENSGKYFLVMEYISGRNLLEVLEKSGVPIAEDRLMIWTHQLLDVLHYLHSQNPPVIYRDLKPPNIMLVDDGTEQIKLIDFGIARFYRPRKTHDTAAYGTSGYSPPEQFGKGQTDQRSDVYALGATLHHLVTNRDPRANPFNWVSANMLNTSVSQVFTSALAKATALVPDQRFQNMEEFAAALGISLPDPAVPRPLASSAPPVQSAPVPVAVPVPPTSTKPPIVPSQSQPVVNLSQGVRTIPIVLPAQPPAVKPAPSLTPKPPPVIQQVSPPKQIPQIPEGVVGVMKLSIILGLLLLWTVSTAPFTPEWAQTSPLLHSPWIYFPWGLSFSVVPSNILITLQDKGVPAWGMVIVAGSVLFIAFGLIAVGVGLLTGRYRTWKLVCVSTWVYLLIHLQYFLIRLFILTEVVVHIPYILMAISIIYWLGKYDVERWLKTTHINTP